MELIDRDTAGYVGSMQLRPLFAVIPVIEVSNGRSDAPAGIGDGGGHPRGGSLRPSQVAQQWIEQGASRLQVVDRDAVAGAGHGNESAIAELVREAHGSAQVDLVAAVRGRSDLDRAAATGANRIVLAADAVADLDFVGTAVASLGDRISLQLVISDTGRLSGANLGAECPDIWSLLPRLGELGVPHYLVCDAAPTGHWWARHHSSLARFCREATRPVTAGSGIGSLERLHQLLELVPAGLDGAVVGDGLRDGAFTFAEAQTAAEARYDPYEWGPAQP